MPFVSFRDRPVSIDEGSREVWLPHETGVSLTTRDHEDDYKRVTMADLMTETNYLNPDVELIAEVNTPESFRTFAEALNTGHGIIGTTHAGDVETLVNRVVEQDVPTYLLDEVDLLVFPRQVDGERYVSEVVEFVDQDRFRQLDAERAADACGVVRKGDATVYWNVVARRRHDGTYDLAYGHPDVTDDERYVDTCVFERLADLTDRAVDDVEADFRRKYRYAEYLQRERITDGDELFALLADLETDEAATVERLGRRSKAAEFENERARGPRAARDTISIAAGEGHGGNGEPRPGDGSSEEADRKRRRGSRGRPDHESNGQPSDGPSQPANRADNARGETDPTSDSETPSSGSARAGNEPNGTERSGNGPNSTTTSSDEANETDDPASGSGDGGQASDGEDPMPAEEADGD